MRFDRVEDLRRSGFRPRVTIVGTGPAGMALAERLADKGIPSLLIEAGGLVGSQRSQAVYRGRVVGDHYLPLDACRLRQFGGSSGCWSGWCRPLDEADFLPRADVPASGWPIRRSDLDPFHDDASRFLRTTVRLPDRPLTPDLDHIAFAYSPPVRLGQDRREAIEASDRIALLTDTAVTELIPVAGRIDALQLVELDGTRHRWPVEVVCVCAGGIENSRLLLWSNRQHQGGAVPQAQALGRYWMDHPVYPIGDAVVIPEGIERFGPRAYFAPTVAAKQRLKIGGAHLWLRQVDNDRGPAAQLVHEAMCMAPAFFDRALDSVDRQLICGRRVLLEWEQMPQADNRIELDDEVDEFGMPRVRMHWRKTDVERRTAETMVRLLGEMLVHEDLGRARMSPWLLQQRDWPLNAQVAGPHHMGGTRMADAPARGVVDGHNRVFGVDNLFIGGSSVFATGGHANPTFTIVQLSLRLGDHLAQRIGHG